ncbi:serine/threonine protein kinase [Paenibacillus flagellatus]|uniref:Serine/threonine protein kinase n=1 Tax=Paenibacillus flagellatus TaxID=2211139 RepID=A0A2V5KX62_9BACL|nr:serine/threonine protein kinase [Paenibacillus flagellatus]PYI54366.1 serine/threonine protein kinase [Paenibacillus flagellatus]
MDDRLHTVRLDDVVFGLREEHDFGWLRRLGRTFAVFDQQDSGNISFGVERGGSNYFVKYAGAKTAEFAGDPEDAVAALRQAVPVYEALRHPALIAPIDHFDTGAGFAVVFEWFGGECLHPHWAFAGPAKYGHPDSPFYRYRRLSVEKRLHSLDVLFDFHRHVEARGYVAVDFYDGSILYEFASDATRICDIDLYRKRPAVNDRGETFWGARRFKSPEEFELGAPIDERSNVFLMGAVAFGLLGGELDRSLSRWEAGPRLHEVALRAVSPDRALRYAHVAEFKAAWDSVR